MLTLNEYYLSATVRVTGTFQDLSDAYADPTTVTLKVKAPDESVVTLVYGVDSALVKDSTGMYHSDVLVDQAGEYCYRWEGTGLISAVQERGFTVNAGCFAP